MTGHRLRIDCAEFRRKLSRETLGKSMFMIFGFLGKSLEDRIPPKLFLETPAASKLILDDPWMLPDAAKIHHTIIRIQKNKRWKPENLDICKDARRKIIEIGLVEILSTSMACHLVTNRMHHMHHENS